MTERVHHPPALIYSTGTQVVALRTIYGQGGRLLHPSGAVGVVVKSPGDLDHSYRVRFPDGVEEALRRDEIVLLAKYKEGALTDSEAAPARAELFDRVLLTGIHLMRTGVVEANLPRLNESARLPYIDELIACKIGGP
ncbi:MAG: hypothetical protein NT069_33605, partial [Planctomycetota bacterium]|nr:hypothetical protein [Planctomycetota bacterium]